MALFFFALILHNHGLKGERLVKKMAYSKGGQAGKKVILSLAVYLGILACGAAAIVGLVLGNQLGEERIPTVCMGLLYGATVMGSVIAAMGKEGWWLPLAAFGAITYILLIGCNITFFEGGLERIGTGSLVVLGAVLTAVGLKYVPISRQGRKRYKHRFR